MTAAELACACEAQRREARARMDDAHQFAEGAARRHDWATRRWWAEVERTARIEMNCWERISGWANQ